MTEKTMKLLQIGELSVLLEAALMRGGLSRDNVRPVAQTILASERDGVRSHGLLRLPGFIETMRLGLADGEVRPEIVEESASLLVVDALSGFAQVALDSSRHKLMAMAKATGTAVLLTRNSHHFAALWPDIEGFAANGFIALTCVNSRNRMAVWGGARPVVGTNAMAFASPRSGHPPLVWDQSSSVLSQGDVLLAQRENRDVEAGVGCDREGRPTTSPSEILEGGSLLAFGSNKGASIAVMVEILAAALSGAQFGFEDTSPRSLGSISKGGQFLMLIDAARANAGFADRIAALLDEILAAGATRLPGDRRYKVRQRTMDEGIALSEEAHAELLQMAGQPNLDL